MIAGRVWRETVSLASRILAAAGHGDLVWGHASCRDALGRGAWLKSAEWGMEEVTPDRVHLVSPSGEVVCGEGVRHSEYPIHTEIYAARPDVGGVVHTHSPYALALAASGRKLLPVSHAATFFAPAGVPHFSQTTDLILTPQRGRQVAAALGDASAIFLVNHGLVTVGPSLHEATVAAIVLEQACRQQLLTSALSDAPIWSDPSEALMKREHIYHDRAISAVWNYLVRKLPETAQQ
ncbi:class II aldolase/adducin family protein [Micromonospora sp. LZ34]